MYGIGILDYTFNSDDYIRKMTKTTMIWSDFLLNLINMPLYISINWKIQSCLDFTCWPIH